MPPTTPSVDPDSMRRLMSDRAFSSALAEYLKDTSSKTTEPSATSVAPFSGDVSDGLVVENLGDTVRGLCGHRRHDEDEASISICVRIWMP